MNVGMAITNHENDGNKEVLMQQRQTMIHNPSIWSITWCSFIGKYTNYSAKNKNVGMGYVSLSDFAA